MMKTTTIKRTTPEYLRAEEWPDVVIKEGQGAYMEPALGSLGPLREWILTVIDGETIGYRIARVDVERVGREIAALAPKANPAHALRSLLKVHASLRIVERLIDFDPEAEKLVRDILRAAQTLQAYLQNRMES